MNYFIASMNIKITEMFDFLESALLTKKFIFVKYYTSSTKKNSTSAKAEKSRLFDDMDISINKSIRTKNSTQSMNTFTASCSSKPDFAASAAEAVEKNFEHKILNLYKNNFFFKIKSEFLSRIRRGLAKPLINDKEIQTNNFNSVVKQKNNLQTKSNYEHLENKTLSLVKENNSLKKSSNNNKNNNDYTEKSSPHNNSDPQNLSSLKALLVNKNSEFLEEVLDKIQNKRSGNYSSLDMDNCDFAIKKDLLNNSKKNNYTNINVNANNLKKKKSSKRTIKNLIASTQQILNGALASSCNNNTHNKFNFNDLNNSNNILNELSKSSEKIGRRVYFPNMSNTMSFNNELQLQNNLLISSNGSTNRNVCDQATGEDNNNYIRRCSSIKELNDVSSSSYSLMKEIKDINTAIENNSKKLENFIEKKNTIKKVFEENLAANSNSIQKKFYNNNNNNNISGNIYFHNANDNAYKIKLISDNNQIEERANNNSLPNHKVSEIKDFNINDFNTNSSKMSDLRICKNIDLSLMENSLLSEIRKESADYTNNFSNKNILNNSININNNNISNCEKNESQNFWFVISNNTPPDKLDSKKINKLKSELINSREYNEEQNSLLYRNNNEIDGNKLLNTSANKNINNTSLGFICKINNSKTNEQMLAAEKVKEFSLISNKEIKSKKSKHISHKSINSSKSKISFTSDNNSKINEESKDYGNNSNNKNHRNNSKNTKNNNINSDIDNKGFIFQKNLKKSSSKLCKNLTNSSNGNNSWDLKNNIMKIRKNNRKSITKKHKESSRRLIKIKDFEEILVENNNKSFEEKTENCSTWKNFFGFFNVFKCGGGANAS